MRNVMIMLQVAVATEAAATTIHLFALNFSA